MKVVPEALVNEYLGLSRRPRVSVNVATLNALGRKWADVRDLERLLRVFAERNDLPLLSSIADQLTEASGLEPLKEN